MVMMFIKPIDLTGAEEITQLAESITDEKRNFGKRTNQKNMIQNIGNDFKTPIAY